MNESKLILEMWKVLRRFVQRGSYTEDAMVTGDIPKRMMQRWSCAEEMTVQGGSCKTSTT